MKPIHAFVFVSIFVFSACSSGILGKKVKEPFQGSAYESNNRFWRGTGKGTSSQDNIARAKADIDAKAQLGGQVNTTMKQLLINIWDKLKMKRQRMLLINFKASYAKP